jgi:Protein of unknown function (DUF402)
MGPVDWKRGDLVVRREVVNGRPWLGVPVYVVEHSDELLALYVPEGAPFAFPPGDWPTESGRHPWDGAGSHWQGPGCLQLQRPGEAYAVWRLSQEDGSLARWYINLQDPFRIHDQCVDTLDHELDIVVTPDGQHWHIKDAERVDVSARQGRFDSAQADRIRRQADHIVATLRSGHRWWDAWLDWNPEPTWLAPDRLPSGWDR